MWVGLMLLKAVIELATFAAAGTRLWGVAGEDAVCAGCARDEHPLATAVAHVAPRLFGALVALDRLQRHKNMLAIPIAMAVSAEGAGRAGGLLWVELGLSDASGRKLSGADGVVHERERKAAHLRLVP